MKIMIDTIFRKFPFSLIALIVFGAINLIFLILSMNFDYDVFTAGYIVSWLFVYVLFFWSIHDVYIIWRKRKIKPDDSDNQITNDTWANVRNTFITENCQDYHSDNYPVYHFEIKDGPNKGSYTCIPATRMTDSIMLEIQSERKELEKAGHKVIYFSIT